MIPQSRVQVPFLSGMHGVGEIRTLFAAEVRAQLQNSSHVLESLSTHVFVHKCRGLTLICSTFCRISGPVVFRYRPSRLVLPHSSNEAPLSCCQSLSIVFYPLRNPASLYAIFSQLILKAKTKYYSSGSLIADSHELAKGLMVLTSGQVGVELPMDSKEADEENSKEDGKTLLYVFGRGCALWQGGASIPTAAYSRAPERVRIGFLCVPCFSLSQEILCRVRTVLPWLIALASPAGTLSGDVLWWVTNAGVGRTALRCAVFFSDKN